MNVVADQLGRPTWARDLAAGALRLAEALLDREAGSGGLFHLSGDVDATWADFARAIFQESAARGGPAAEVRDITTADYPTPARRPANSRLDSGRIGQVLDVPASDWRAGLAAVLAEIEAGRA